MIDIFSFAIQRIMMEILKGTICIILFYAPSNKKHKTIPTYQNTSKYSIIFEACFFFFFCMIPQRTTAPPYMLKLVRGRTLTQKCTKFKIS